jgi:hypothetical protein
MRIQPTPTVNAEEKIPTFNVLVINAPNCAKCPNLTTIAKAIEEQLPGTTVSEYDTTEGKEIITKYELKKLPALIITGNVTQTPLAQSPMFTQKADGLVYQTSPPYQDLEGNTYGVVTITAITDTNCTACVNSTTIALQLEQIGVIIGEVKNYTTNSIESRKLIKKYNITKLPAFIFSKDLNDYPFVQQSWAQLGSIEEDGSMILRKLPPPFVENGRMRGITQLTMITDESCTECYNVTLFPKVLTERFKILIDRQKTTDISNIEGQNLIKKYNITNVPTIILRGDTTAYDLLTSFFEEAGTTESDGTIVFRNLDLFRVPYKNLNTNTVVQPVEQ